MSGRPRAPRKPDEALEARLQALQSHIAGTERALVERNKLLLRMADRNGYTQQSLVNLLNAANKAHGVRDYSVDAVGIALHRMRAVAK